MLRAIHVELPARFNIRRWRDQRPDSIAVDRLVIRFLGVYVTVFTTRKQHDRLAPRVPLVSFSRRFL